MSVGQFHKCTTINDSGIPVPKRNNIGKGAKHRKCAQLPELQKYIETIIKASNEYDSEDVLVTEKDRFPKERKFETYSVFKGIESKARQEKNKIELNLTRSKSNIKAKSPLPEAVSRGVNVYNMFAPEFEDPRNWKLSNNSNLGPSTEIEKFLKEFYPNPYRLENIIEFTESKNKKDELRDGTLPDVVISETNIHKEVNIEKRNSDLKTADTETCTREGKTLISDASPEKQSSLLENNNAVAKSVEVSTPNLLDNSYTMKGKHSTNSSRTSSPESTVSETLSKDNQLSFKKIKNMEIKSGHKYLKAEMISEYDIGKLKLLNLTDSDHSLRVDKTKINEGEDKSLSVNEITSADEELVELKEICDIMNKATESFLYLSKRNGHVDGSLGSNALTDKLSFNTETSNFSETKLDLNESDKTRKEIYSKHWDNSLETVADTFPREKSQTSQEALINIPLDEGNFEYTSKQEDGLLEQVSDDTEIFSKCKIPTLKVAKKEISEEDRDFAATNQKIDEVLDFMYDCLKKFNRNRGRFKPEEEQKFAKKDERHPLKSTSWRRFQKHSLTDVNHEKPTTSVLLGQNESGCGRKDNSTASLLRNSFPDIKEIQSKYTAALGEINRKASKIRCRKKPSLLFSAFDQLSHYQAPVIETSAPENRTTSPQPSQQQVEEVYENSAMLSMQTVESQNELGGYTEESQESAVVNENTRIPKPICPLSAKRKKSKMNTTKKLKDVLEAEEKLLTIETGEKHSDEKANEEKSEELIICKSETQERVQNETQKIYSQFSDFKQSNSNFLICLNSFSRDLKSLTNIQRNTLPVPISTSLIDLKKECNFRRLMLYSVQPLKKLSVGLEAGQKVLQCTYNIKQENLMTFGDIVVFHSAEPVCMKLTLQSAEEFRLRKSQCLVMITDKPEKPVYSTGGAIYSIPILSSSEILPEEEKPVKALIEAIEETEEKVFLLEQKSAENLFRNTDSCNLSAVETKNEYSMTEKEKINDREKIRELLVRTYNLQQKLQRYLQKVPYLQPISISSPSMEEGILDFREASKNEIGVYIKSEAVPLPAVHWHLKTSETDAVLTAEEYVMASASMVDDSTSYDPPVAEESYEKLDSSEIQQNRPLSPKDTNEQVFQDSRNDDDDRSSIYSFKSSQEFSEAGNIKKEPKQTEYKTNKKLFQKIFNEIEQFRQSFEAEKLLKNQQDDTCPQEGEPEEKRLVQYDPKIPAKVLRTVFTGKRSSTELTIGLKDVPMTKVGNISVEKTKFSPNHTKISVAFIKDNEQQNRVSSYFYDQTRHSLSNCLTEISESKHCDSKTSQSLAEDSEEEDDFKSVASSFGNTDSDKEEKLETKEEENVGTSPPRNYVKHRFDFYRKMNTDLDVTKPKPKSPVNSLCRYKELEPLKQALTEMQIRMRNIRRDAVFSSCDYYERALKLAKMSAGFCQSCGNRTVIPEDTFGYYKSLLPRRSMHRRNRHFRPSVSPNSSFYSLRSSTADVGNQYCELGIKHSSYTLNPMLNSNRTILRSSLQDMPILFEKL